jgi:glycosyltransferase involved in cell wall biosynthesis
MPVYNAQPYLAEALESVVSQTHRDFELIAVNDGSEDGSLAILEEYAARDTRIRVISQTNLGVAWALNRAICESSAEWIVVMHADDIMEKERIERQLEFLNQNPELDVFSCFVINIDSSGRIIGESQSTLTTEDAVRQQRETETIIGFHHPGVMMRKDAVTSVGGYRQEFWPAEDLDLWNRIADGGGRILVQPEYLIRYRIHENAASIRDARLVRSRMNWIAHCSICRRQNHSEPTYEEFTENQRRQSLLTRLNVWRRDTSQILYKQAGFLFSIRKRAQATVAVGASTVLDPFYAPLQVWNKLIRHRIFQFNRRSVPKS